ncbi:hypothetical protein JD82_03545 [Prauserella rugosa]|uniref:Uncharacterized protein n=1 Tax=Prauserella rugosa TaxID=43354 RepID=A0A660CJA0_9PSEU|nr:hypothetical protein JD82_03545 [Prauserella rugosa]
MRPGTPPTSTNARTAPYQVSRHTPRAHRAPHSRRLRSTHRLRSRPAPPFPTSPAGTDTARPTPPTGAGLHPNPSRGHARRGRRRHPLRDVRRRDVRRTLPVPRPEGSHLGGRDHRPNVRAGSDPRPPTARHHRNEEHRNEQHRTARHSAVNRRHRPDLPDRRAGNPLRACRPRRRPAGRRRTRLGLHRHRLHRHRLRRHRHPRSPCRSSHRRPHRVTAGHRGTSRCPRIRDGNRRAAAGHRRTPGAAPCARGAATNDRHPSRAGR